jgi:hypothetical protein
MGRAAEGALVGKGAGEVDQFLGAAINRSRSHHRPIKRRKGLEHFGPVGHDTEEKVRLLAASFQAGQKLVFRGIHGFDR